MNRSPSEEIIYKRYVKRDVCISHQTDTFKMKGKERRRGSKKKTYRMTHAEERKNINLCLILSSTLQCKLSLSASMVCGHDCINITCISVGD
jgi:hypothetical protein